MTLVLSAAQVQMLTHLHPDENGIGIVEDPDVNDGIHVDYNDVRGAYFRLAINWLGKVTMRKGYAQ